MSHRCYAILSLVLLLTLWSTAGALAPGDTIRLKQRDIHIPAHPAPDDNHVYVRFPSDTTATVLRIDAASGWVEIRGTPVHGGQDTGWIASRHIASSEGGGGPTPGPLDWCPAKGSPAPHASGRLRLATWNLANLHAHNGQSIFPDSEKRQDLDYARMRCYVRLMDPDILAVQEVDGVEALQRVIDMDVYTVHVSSRLPGTVGKQNTGFASRKGLQVSP